MLFCLFRIEDDPNNSVGMLVAKTLKL